jgi:hypothetical protein
MKTKYQRAWAVANGAGRIEEVAMTQQDALCLVFNPGDHVIRVELVPVKKGRAK